MKNAFNMQFDWLITFRIKAGNKAKHLSNTPHLIFINECVWKQHIGISILLQGDICIKNGECFDMTNANCATSNIVPVKHPDASLYLIIGIVVGSVFVLAVIIMVIIKIYNHKRYWNIQIILTVKYIIHIQLKIDLGNVSNKEGKTAEGLQQQACVLVQW